MLFLSGMEEESIGGFSCLPGSAEHKALLKDYSPPTEILPISGERRVEVYYYPVSGCFPKM